MKKYILIIAFIAFNITACNNKVKSKTSENSDEELTKETSANVSKGYELMKQKCFICHFEKPDPAKMAQMIAPPMLRVQEHYKPAYAEKENFVKAVMAYVNNPSQDKTLMPGAVKKFNLMPKVVYDQNELKTIVETLYGLDLGSMPKMHMKRGKGLTLNNGQKWKLKSESIDQVQIIIKKLNAFESDNISDYNQLGKDVFDDAKMILLDKDYTGELFDQIHFFFGGIEDNMHALIATKSIGVANKQVTILKSEFDNFNKYFE